MILYHGSNQVIDKPDLLHSRANVDFGRGFYTTPLREQAEKWAARYTFRGQDAVLSRSTLDEKALQTAKVLSFDAYTEEWLDFILHCRQGQDTSDYDIVIGGVANDKVFNTVELYSDGLIDKNEAIKRLRYEKPNLQICLRTQSIIDSYLHFDGSEIL